MDIKIIDEHHAAFLCIEEAFRNKIYTKACDLVHVDSHSDMGNVFTLLSCYDENYKKYVEEHINIGNFIIPLILNGRLKKILYVNVHDKKKTTSLCGSLFGEGRIIRQNIPKTDLERYPDAKKWEYKEITDIALLKKMTNESSCILDIDCDYFCCYNVPLPSWKRDYDKIPTNLKSDDEYKIKFNKASHFYKSKMRSLIFNNDKRWINLCIDFFGKYIGMKPRLVIISKSMKTGYTPSKYCEYIVKRLVEVLNDPPKKLNIPMSDTLKIRDDVIIRKNTFANLIKGDEVILDDDQLDLVKGIIKGRTVGELIGRVKRKCELSEEDAVYESLRFIFFLKRMFMIH